jgi:hypothetical protein
MASNSLIGKNLSISSMLKPVPAQRSFPPNSPEHTGATADVDPDEGPVWLRLAHLAKVGGAQAQEGVAALEEACPGRIVHCTGAVSTAGVGRTAAADGPWACAS